MALTKRLRSTGFLFTLVMGITTTLFAQEPTNLSALKDSLTQYYDSGEYFKSLQNTAEDVRQYLALRVTENNMSKKKQNLAIVLDIDETVLSNIPFLKERHFCSSFDQINKNQAKENLEAIEPIKSVYQFAQQNHIAIFFVTARPQSLEKATIDNLKHAGFDGWVGLYCRPLAEMKSPAQPFKQSIRKTITTRGYTIIATIGDQTSDIEGKYAEKGFKLSNPFY